MHLILLLVAAAWSGQALADFPEAQDIRWVERPGFTGTVFTVNGLKCEAGVFGDLVMVTGTACEGDPWAEP